MQIADNAIVTLHYTLKNQKGEVLDSSEGAEPLAYLHGAEEIVPGLERELLGLGAGDIKDVTVQPADGYGDVDPEAVFTMPRGSFPSDVTEGDQLVGEDDEGNAMPVRVVKLDAEEVTVDANHPLAGEVLFFHVEIQGVRAATEEELEHGHAHGPDGHGAHDDDDEE